MGRHIGGVGPDLVGRKPPITEHAVTRSLLVGSHNPPVRKGPLVRAPATITGFSGAKITARATDPGQVSGKGWTEGNDGIHHLVVACDNIRVLVVVCP